MGNRQEIRELCQRFAAHDRQALSRLLTLASRGEQLEEIRHLVGAARAAPLDGQRGSPSRRVVAITGSPGVGKSTLVGRLIEVLRHQGSSVAVLACDPQSPLTGGALLGDRFRMPSRPEDPQVFIRSLATPGGRGAIPEHIDLMVALLQAFGFAWVILETVGAGQGETAVRHVADVVVLLVQPEAGDDIQWEKAGLFEVADLIVVHKADLPGADKVEAQIRTLVNLPGCREVPVLRVSSHQKEGLEELVKQIEILASQSRTSASSAKARLRDLLRERFVQAFEQLGGQAEELVRGWEEGRLSDEEVFAEVIERMASSSPSAN